MPRWEQVLAPLESQLRADGTVGPVRFRAVASRPIAIPPVDLPAVPVRPVATLEPAVHRAVPRRIAAMPVLGRLRLHLEYVRREDQSPSQRVGPQMQERAWFRHEVERLDRVRRRARPVGHARLVIPGTAPDAVESLVEYFGIRAVSRALARVAKVDHPLRHPASVGPLSPSLARGIAPTAVDPDARASSARERAARRGFFVA